MNRFIMALISLFLFSCASTPKSGVPVNDPAWESRFWDQQCQPKKNRRVEGELVLRAQTPEFKGQFPAVLKVEGNGDFFLEMTHLFGGTLGQIIGKNQMIEVLSFQDPKHNQKGLKSYLGLPYSFWVPLLRGNLPCPRDSHFQGHSSQLRWSEDGKTFQNWEVKGLFSIEALDFDEESGRLESGKISTSQGELKWKWKEFQEF